MNTNDWILILGFSFLVFSISQLVRQLSKKLDAIYDLQFDTYLLRQNPNIDKSQLRCGWMHDINP